MSTKLFVGNLSFNATQEQLQDLFGAHGTVVEVDVIKDNQEIYSTAPKKQNVDFEFTDKGSVKGRHFYYIRLTQEDGMIAWTSPMFINYR